MSFVHDLQIDNLQIRILFKFDGFSIAGKI